MGGVAFRGFFTLINFDQMRQAESGSVSIGTKRVSIKESGVGVAGCWIAGGAGSGRRCVMKKRGDFADGVGAAVGRNVSDWVEGEGFHG